ncbi:MAG: hypothetical protein GY710_03110 [Desulfobacteraceae bacterium]|nr:hypothetical protein [Desulfobacteraceae bacterium]
MKNFIFIYDRIRSQKNSLFTVRLSLGEKQMDKKGTLAIWKLKERGKIFKLSDIAALSRFIPDKNLFKLVMESELTFRKIECSFSSRNDEMTLFRISAFDLETFIKKSTRLKILCNDQGDPLNVQFFANIKPEISITKNKAQKKFHLKTTVMKRLICDANYIIQSKIPTLVYGNTIICPVPGITHDFLFTLKDKENQLFSSTDIEKETLCLLTMKNKITLNLPEEKKYKTIKPETLQPQLDLSSNLKFARLSFVYDGQFSVLESEKKSSLLFHKQKTQLIRNIEKEQHFISLLKKSGIQHRPSAEENWFISSVNRHETLIKISKQLFVIKVLGLPLNLTPDLEWQLTTQKNTIDLKSMKNSRAILESARRRENIFTMSDGTAGYLNPTLLEELGQLIKKGIIKKDTICLKKGEFSALTEFTKNQRVKSDLHFKELTACGTPEKLKASKIPEGLTKILRPYQKMGFYWLKTLEQHGLSGILADDMGLGKTIQVLTLLLSIKNKKHPPTLLIIPKTLIHNWESEIQKFAPTLSFLIHSGHKRANGTETFTGKDVIITSYALMRIDFELFKGMTWEYIILDEAQAIKNPGSKITGNIKRLNSHHRLCLSGTPVENRPQDLWSHFDFLMPGLLGHKKQFNDSYGANDHKALDQLQKIVQPFILRRLKHQVCLELPGKTEVTIFCDFDEEQKKIYDRILKTGRADIAKTKNFSAVNILTILLKLRQAACHQALTTGEHSKNSFIKQNFGKHAQIVRTAEQILAGTHKILIFSQFTNHLKLVKKAFQTRGLKTFYFDGSTQNRDQVIQDFQEEKMPCAFFISIKAGGVGLNLTQADYVFLLDPWWNPAVENQAIDRTYRIGQKNPVTVYRFITKDSIEEKVSLLQQVKHQIEKNILSEEKIDSIPLDEKSLRKLLD